MKKILFLSLCASVALLGDVMVLKNGWNLVSSPYGDKSVPISIFGEKIESKWEYVNGNWGTPSILTPGKGIWLKVSNGISADVKDAARLPKKVELSVMLQESQNLAWNLLGAPELLGSNELKSKGAKTFWLYDENDATWKSEATVQVGRGFWIYKDSSLAQNSEPLEQNTLTRAVDAILVGSDAGAAAAQSGGNTKDTLGTTMDALKTKMGSARSTVADLKIASMATLTKSIRYMQLDTMKASILAQLSSVPEPYKSEYTSKISSATSLQELLVLQSQLQSLQSQSSQAQSGAQGCATKDQIAPIEAVESYLDGKTKGWFESIKKCSMADGFNQIAFESGVKNAYMEKAYSDQNGTNPFPGRFENGIFKMEEMANNQKMVIETRFFKDGAQITHNLDDPRNYMKYDDNGNNIAPLKELLLGVAPDFSKVKAKASVNFADGFVLNGAKAVLKRLESDEFDVPLSPKELPYKMRFSGEGEVALPSGQKWALKDLKLYVYDVSSITSDALTRKIEGSYKIEESVDGKSIKGSVEFDSSGCKGAEISVDGKYAGKIVLVDGKLYTELPNGTRVESKISF